MNTNVNGALPQPLSHVNLKNIKITAILQIVWASLSILYGIVVMVFTLVADQLTIGAALYLPAGVFGLMAANDIGIKSVTAYQIFSAISCTFAAIQSLQYFVLMILVFPFFIGGFLLNLAQCITSGIAAGSIQSSLGCCWQNIGSTISESHALNTVVPMPPLENKPNTELTNNFYQSDGYQPQGVQTIID